MDESNKYTKRQVMALAMATGAKVVLNGSFHDGYEIEIDLPDNMVCTRYGLHYAYYSQWEALPVSEMWDFAGDFLADGVEECNTYNCDVCDSPSGEV